MDPAELDRLRLRYQTSFSDPPSSSQTSSSQPGRSPRLLRMKRDHLSSSAPHPLPPPPTSVSYEVPSRPGCRSVATKTCRKVPTYVEKKVPYSDCFPVPTLDCGVVLRTVPELDCTPQPRQDCKKVAKPIPYLVEEEQCEQVVYDECQEVETTIPVEECKRQRFGQETIFLSRGQVTRKEGEKRRRKLFRRLTGGKDKKGSSKLSDKENSKTETMIRRRRKRRNQNQCRNQTATATATQSQRENYQDCQKILRLEDDIQVIC